MLSDTAVGADLDESRTVAYRLVEGIELPDGQHRTDIALKTGWPDTSMDVPGQVG